MLILRAGLYLAVLVALYVTWASRGAGYPIEVAALRGLIAFMAVTFVAYLAELVVITAPVPERARGARGQTDDDGALDEGDDDEAGADEPATLPAVRAEREIAADQRRAA